MQLVKEEKRKCKKCKKDFQTKTATRQCLMCRTTQSTQRETVTVPSIRKRVAGGQDTPKRVKKSKSRISKKVREENQKNPFFEKCCVPNCPNKDIEWHHALEYAGKQITNMVVPVCYSHHREKGLTVEGRLWGKLWCITLNRKTLVKNYPKKDWMQEKRYLEGILKHTL